MCSLLTIIPLNLIQNPLYWIWKNIILTRLTWSWVSTYLKLPFEDNVYETRRPSHDGYDSNIHGTIQPIML